MFVFTETTKSSILIGFSLINHPFWVPPFMETAIHGEMVIQPLMDVFMGLAVNVATTPHGE